MAVHRVVTLSSEEGFARGLGHGAKELLPALDDAAVDATLLRLSGRSPSRRRRFRAAGLPMLVDVDRGEVARLHFELPAIGEAFPDLYRQKDFFSQPPPEHWTAFELLAESLVDVRAGNNDSERFDRGLLRRVAALGKGLRHGVQRVAFADIEPELREAAIIDEQTVDLATELAKRIPRPRPARIVGTLDMIRHSTASFELVLDDGARVRGVLSEGESESLKALFGRRVVVDGRVVYRASRRPLRIEARSVSEGSTEPAVFSRVPAPRELGGAHRARRLQTEQTGVNAIWGRWPGDESEEDLLAQLAELRRA